MCGGVGAPDAFTQIVRLYSKPLAIFQREGVSQNVS